MVSLQPWQWQTGPACPLGPVSAPRMHTARCSSPAPTLCPNAPLIRSDPTHTRTCGLPAARALSCHSCSCCVSARRAMCASVSRPVTASAMGLAVRGPARIGEERRERAGAPRSQAGGRAASGQHRKARRAALRACYQARTYSRSSLPRLRLPSSHGASASPPPHRPAEPARQTACPLRSALLPLLPHQPVRCPSL